MAPSEAEASDWERGLRKGSQKIRDVKIYQNK